MDHEERIAALEKENQKLNLLILIFLICKFITVMADLIIHYGGQIVSWFSYIFVIYI